jgi:hypothetical protein
MDNVEDLLILDLLSVQTLLQELRFHEPLLFSVYLGQSNGRICMSN